MFRTLSRKGKICLAVIILVIHCEKTLDTQITQVKRDYLQCQGIAMWHVSTLAEKTKDCVSMKGVWNMFRALQTLNKMCEVVQICVPEGSTILARQRVVYG